MITIKRISENEHGTFGVLIKDNIPLCVTLEDMWKDNKRNISCIPAGMYHVVKHFGRKYKDVWRIENVPNRYGILIHSGNTEEDTTGCVLVGKHYGFLGGKYAILDSMETINALRNELPDEFWLKIVDV